MSIETLPGKLKEKFKSREKVRKYDNAVDAAYWAKLLLKVSGITVFELKSLPGDKIVVKFTPIGFIFYLFWYSVFLYCGYASFYGDQTILRMLYNTKLRRFGDDYEWYSCIIYSITVMTITPFRLNGNRVLMQKIVDIDLIIEKTGGIIKYNRMANTAVILSVCEMIACIIRLVCTYFTLRSIGPIPVAKMLQMYFTDSLAMVTVALYCYYLLMIIQKFRWINKSLNEIKSHNFWEHKVFMHGNASSNLNEVVEIADKQKEVCEKIKICARIYSMCYESCVNLSSSFAITIMFAMLYYCNLIILYLFYFMEATASGLFHDLNKYLDFVLYTFWVIAISLGIMFLIVSFSEMAVKEAKQTSSRLHQIINEDLSPSINKQAQQFTIQLLHQTPVFTVCGFYNLDYAYLQQCARSVATYLIILLQFVMENKQ